jgi:type I restriction enzyme S subunit
MTDLPNGWEWTTLGEIAESRLGKMLDRKKDTGEHPKPYLRNINVQWGRIDTNDVLTMDIPPEQQDFFRIIPGDLLVCEGGEIGRCAIWRQETGYMAFQKALHRVRPLNGIAPEYLRYLMEYLSIQGQLLSFATGSTIKHLPQEQLRRLPVPLAPLAEQQRIVSVLEDHLSRVEAAVKQLRMVAQRASRMRDRVMEAAATGAFLELENRNHAAAPAPAGVADGDLPKVPGDWHWTRLGDIAQVIGGIAKDSKKQSDPHLPLVSYLRVANVQRARLDLTEIAEIRVPEARVKQLALKSGDVLLNEGGDRDKLGRGWIWENQIPCCIHQNHVFRARVIDAVLHPKLLAWHANGFGRLWFERNGTQSVNLASISLSKMKLFPVPIPPPDIQQSLVSEAEKNLTLLDNAEDVIRHTLERVKHLRKALLREAFEGRLVSQHPSDEPALDLLVRIRSERAAQSGKRSPRGSHAPATASHTEGTAIAVQFPGDASVSESSLISFEQEELPL